MFNKNTTTNTHPEIVCSQPFIELIIMALLKRTRRVDVSAPGSREAFTLREEIRVYHRPHPQSTMDKGAVNATRIWLESMGIKP